MSIAKIGLVAAALSALAGPALADGFRYAGSPKFGEFYVYASPQAHRPDTTARQTSLLNAHGSLSTATMTPFKGGIGNRAP